jgi:phosphoserine phosphatase
MTPRYRYADFKLLAMDMDSTLINIECVDEIGAAVGKKAEIAAITEAAMRGEIADYAESLRQRVALLQGVSEQALQDIYDHKLQLNPGAERLLSAARAAGWKTLLVSGGFTFFTERLKARLKLDYAHSNVLEVRSGKLTGRLVGDIVDGEGKRRAVQSVCNSLNCTTANAVVMGDGSNDLPMMRIAGLSVAYHAKPAVRAEAMLAIDNAGLDALLDYFEPNP